MLRNVIYRMLRMGNIKKEYVNLLLNEKNMNLYQQAFTSKSVDPNCNYEYFEQLGDLSINKFIVWYSYERFPQLKCSKGVKIVARIRINHCSKNVLSNTAESLGFWDVINASEDERGHRKKDLLEDCFESFIGCTEYILNNDVMNGVGWVIVQNILKSIYNKRQISLRYEDLFDSKTRLKELFDLKQDHKITYSSVRENDFFTTRVMMTEPNGYVFQIGKGVAPKKQNAEQIASEVSLSYLYNTKGWLRYVPEFYDL